MILSDYNFFQTNIEVKKYMKIAVIGGTGLYDPKMLTNVEDIHFETTYGNVSGTIGTFDGYEVIFLPRHGRKHSVPPHKVNYRANIAALKNAGVTHILATAAVGSLNENMKPGDYVIIDNFLDFTKARPSTFYDGTTDAFVHIDCTEPYCNSLREILITVAKSLALPVHPNGCYVCTEGPRFETSAEIRMYRMMHADIVGMTNVPEVVLAREAGICYATICIVTNYAAGISLTHLSHEEVLETTKKREEDTKKLISKTIHLLLKSERKECTCPKHLKTITDTLV
jgi:5'-methylthioadenosine phosphorylase